MIVGQRVGYARVSTSGQDLGLQLETCWRQNGLFFVERGSEIGHTGFIIVIVATAPFVANELETNLSLSD